MNWYCLHTKPLKEGQVALHCQEKLGLEVYFPRIRSYRSVRRQRKLVTRPLFPRYIFCRFDLAVHYRAVRYAPEIIDLVHSGPFPSLVEDQLIDQLKDWATESTDLLTLRPPFYPGETVELVEGPMQGLSARILNICNDRDRVAILLSILECGAQMVVSRCQLRKVS